MTVSREEVKNALVAAGITGPHQSHSRHNNISKIRACLAGDPDGCFGLTDVTSYSETEVLGFLAELTGCSADIADEAGYDTIDPDRTIDGLLAAGRRLRVEAEQGRTLLAVTGHPTGMLECYIRVVDAYRAAGGKVMRLCEGKRFYVGKKEHEVRYNGGVGCMADWGALKHTHAPDAMEAILTSSDTWPDLVLGDHGFAGAAIERDIPTIAVMDINDPALAIAWAEEKDVLIVPMDDNRPPRLYEPAWTLIEQVLSGQEV